MGVWGQTRDAETFTFSDLNIGDATAVETIEGDNVTLTFSQGTGTNAPKYYANGTAVRMYTNNTLQVALNEQTGTTRITAVNFTFSGSYTGSIQNWTGSDTSVSFTNTASGQARIQVIAVTFSEGGTTTFTVTYDCNGGTSGCPENVTGIAANTQIQLAGAPTKTDYTFNGWSDGNTTYQAGADYTVTSNVTFTAQWTDNTTPGGDEQWVLTNLADLTTNDVFVIVGNNGSNYAMSNNKGTSSAPDAVSVTIENNQITSTVTSTIQWTGITGNATNGYTIYSNADNTKYLYCINNNNGVRVGTGNDKTFIIKDNYIYNNGQGRYLGVYNSSDWRSYTSINNNIANQTFAFYKKVTGGVLPPSITAEDVNIPYDATSGSITYTITNGVEGGAVTSAEVTASNPENWLTVNGSNPYTTPISLSCAANATATEKTATVTLTYTYNRETVTETVNVTQAANPNATMTIAEVRALSTGTTVATKGVVTSISVSGSNKTAYFQDNTAGIVAYGPFDTTVAVGDEIRVEGELTSYNGLLEIGKSNAAPTVTVLSQNNTVTPVVKTIAEISNGIQAQLVKVENATVTAIDGQNTTIAQGENTIVVRGISGVEYVVNDVLTLIANVGCYNNNPQLVNPQNVEVQHNTTPVINASNPETLAYDATSGSIAYTISNPDEGVSLNATTTANWISNIEVGESEVTFTTTVNEGTEDRTATFVLTYEGADDKEITVTQGHPVVDYATLPFAFNNGKNAIEETNGLTQSGLGSDYADENTKLKFDSTDDFVILKINERPGILTFYIKGNSFSGGTFKVQTSADGVSYSDLETYTTFGNNETFEEEFDNLNENVRYIKWVYTNKSSGNVGLGNITLGEYVAPQPSITVETNVINVDAESHQEFLNVNFVNFEPTTGNAFTCDANGTFTDYSWLVAELDINNNRVRYTIGNNEEVARTGYFRVKCGDVYSEIVTVNQAAYVPPFEPATYIPATEINPDKRYIIVGFNDGDAYAMGYQKTNNRHAVGISFDGTTATVETSEVYELVIANQGDYYTIYDERTPGFLYAASDEKNWLRTEEELDDDGNGLWNITFGEQGLVDLVAVNTNVRNVMQFNAGSSTTDPLFACYASANQEPVYLYEKVESAEYTLEITGYTDDSEKTGYHLIASPVFVDPYLVGMADGDFDLYSFDQSEEEEWRNYEAGSFTMLEPGKGYLYAKKATDNVQTYYFNLSGTPYVGDGYIDLAYDANEGVSFPGLNLIGNPFGEEATLNIPYYRMNSTGSGLEAVNETESPVNVMEGVFVYAEYNSEYGYVTNYAQFTPNGNTSGGGGMKINLTRNRGTVIDNAIVRFDNGRQLPKFQLFENNTKLYIPQGNEDYAIVRSAAQGEMPVSFRASENGTYTIAVEAENVDMNYLHLIDNMTGADVDLLATPNYTFEARTNDYTSRFRLVFSANGIDEQTAETFAFFNGTSWTVSNTGDATLQVIDITGRIVSSETINGNATVSLNQPAGIYMLRLVNGNDVKVQKVVVR